MGKMIKIESVALEILAGRHIVEAAYIPIDRNETPACFHESHQALTERKKKLVFRPIPHDKPEFQIDSRGIPIGGGAYPDFLRSR